MGALTEAGLNEIITSGCRSCGSRRLAFRTYADARLPLMGGEPVGSLTWAYDGEKFVDGVFEVTCGQCQQVIFESDVCPRCNAAGALAHVLSTPNTWPVPSVCPGCDDDEVRYIALVPAEVVFSDERAGKARTSTEILDPGFHGFRVDCVDCGTVDELHAACPLCGAPAPLRPRP